MEQVDLLNLIHNLKLIHAKFFTIYKGLQYNLKSRSIRKKPTSCEISLFTTAGYGFLVLLNTYSRLLQNWLIYQVCFSYGSSLLKLTRDNFSKLNSCLIGKQFAIINSRLV